MSIQTEGIDAHGWTVALRESEPDTLELTVYDVIGAGLLGDGSTARHMLEKLRGAPKSKRITLRINSADDVVDDAKAMINLLTDRKKSEVTVHALVDGMAASAASYLTTVADKVTMPSNAFFMFHQARAGSRGTAGDFEVAAKVLRQTNEQMAEAYAAASQRRGKARTKDDYLAEMAKGDMYLTADEAIEWGLADEKTEPLKAVACLADMTDLTGAPDALRAAPYVVQTQARHNISAAPAAKSNRAAPEGTIMTLSVFAKELGLTESADEPTIRIGIAALRERAVNAEASVRDIEAAAGKSGKETLGAIAAFKASHEALPAIREELAGIKAAQEASDRAALVEAILADGKAPEGKRAHLEAQSVDFLKAYAELAGPVVPGAGKKPPKETVNGESGLSAGDMKHAEDLGMTPEAYRAAKAALPKTVKADFDSED